MYSRVGHTMPAHSTGVGKAILAFLSVEELEAALPKRLGQRTESTITDKDVLREHLATVRARGYSTDNVENEEGIRCVGAPVFDHTGAVSAAISIAGPANRVTSERFAELGEQAREIALKISARIGHRGPETQGQPEKKQETPAVSS
jgi:DNA-binding IclR family transcriptional regulator